MKAAEINTRKGKRKFIHAICRSIEKQVIDAVPRMPSKWDGHQMRELLSDMFNRERTATMQRQRKEYKEYQADCYNHNIP